MAGLSIRGKPFTECATILHRNRVPKKNKYANLTPDFNHFISCCYRQVRGSVAGLYAQSSETNLRP